MSNNNNKQTPDINFSRDETMASNQTLRETQARYKAILEGTNVGTWEWNIQTGETIFNERWAQIIGYHLEELSPTTIDTWAKVTHPDDLKKCQEKLEGHFQGEQDHYECECRIKHKDGHWVWVLDRGTVMEWSHDGKPLWMFGTHTDITRLKQTQEELLSQKKALHERNKEISCIFNMSEIVRNQSLKWGEILQQVVSIIPPAFQNPLLTCAKIVFKGTVYQTATFIQTPVKLTSDIIIRGEEVGTLEVCLKKDSDQENVPLFLDSEKRLVHSLSERIGQIGEHKASEKALIEREEKFRTLFETMAQGVVYHNKTGEIIACNASAEKILGLSLSQMQGRTSLDPRWQTIHEDGSPFPGQGHPAMVALRTGKPVYGEIIGVFHPKEQRYHWIKVNAIPQFQTGNDEPYQVYASFEDITREVKAQQRARESETALQEVYDAIQDGISVLDTDMRIIQYNKWIEETHHKEETLVGKKCYEVYQNRPSPCPNCPVIQCLASGKVQTQEVKFSAKDGQQIWTETSAFPIKNSKGQVIKIIEYVKDITERKRAQMEIERFKTISDNSLYGTCITDAQGFITYVNEYYSRIHGYAPKDVKGKNVSIFHTDVQLSAIKKQTQPLLKNNGRFPAVETWHIHKSGSEFPMLMSGILLKDGAGGEPFLAVSAVNITDQKELEFALKEQQEELKASNEEMEALNEELMESVEEAKKANQAKSDFLANMSHELRTPLNGILGFGEILKNSISNEDQLRYLEIILTSANNLLEIIKDILDFSKIEARKLDLRPKETALRPLIEKTVSVIRRSAEKKGLDLFVEVGELVPEKVTVDGPRLGQILVNLLSNAVKFTQKGEIHLTVQELARQKGRTQLHFQVLDTGIGIRQEDLEMVFEPFQQVDMSNTREYGGTGLGLTIVNDLLKKMGSRLDVKSTYSQGSRFYFELALPRNQETVEHHNGSDPEKKSDHSFLKNKKILIAEDNPVNMKYALTALHMFCDHIKLFKANNGREAYEQYCQHQPDLILMDVVMPGINGYQATAMIRQQDSQIPIIALTAKAQKEDKDACIAAGMNDYITKPFSLTQLRQSLERHLCQGDTPLRQP